MTEERARACVILAHNRQDMLDQCIDAIWNQVDEILVIDNASDPEMKVRDEGEHVIVHRVPDQPPNLARLWNHGLDFFVEEYEGYPFDVAVLCDDALVPIGWFEAVQKAMRNNNCLIGCSNPWGSFHDPIVKRQPDKDIAHRMPGWAWIMDGTRTIRADERMQWWWLDTDLDFRARLNGGTVMISGFPVANQQPNAFTNARPDLAGRAGEDGVVFASIWNERPW